MPPPSQLAIATSALNRLVKEEKSYHDELQQQQASIAKLEEGGGDENADFTLRQERKAVEETKAMFPRLKAKIQDTLARLEQQLEQDQGANAQTSPDDITKANEAIAAARTTLGQSS